MNIGFVTSWFERGAAYVSKAYLETLQQGGHRVFVYARGGESYARNNPKWDREYVTWGKRANVGIPGFIYWSDFKNWIERNHLDVLIFNEQHSWDVLLRCLRLNIPLGTYVDYYTHKTIPFFKLYDFLLCNTQKHYSVFKDHPQALYIPWGVDLASFKVSSTPVSDSGVVFFHSCGYSPSRKGTDLVVKAFRDLKGKARLIIHAQQSPDSELLDAINQNPNVILIEKTVPVPGLYHLGDVYVYPTRLEGLGLTIGEALASSLPVITTDNGPMNEFVVNGVNGNLVPVEFFRRREDNYYWDESICNVAELTKVMQWYINQRSLLSEFKNQARQYAEYHLNWQKNSQDLSIQLMQIKRINKPSSLIWELVWFEYSRYPRLVIKAFMRKINRRNN